MLYVKTQKKKKNTNTYYPKHEIVFMFLVVLGRVPLVVLL